MYRDHRDGLVSVPEMADAGEHHRHAVRVGSGNHLGIAQRAAGLDHRGDAGRGGGAETRQGATGDQAIESGVDPKDVWRELCSEFDVPRSRW